MASVGWYPTAEGMRPKERRHLRTRLHEAEDVVDEEEHVLAFGVAEMLGQGQACQRHSQAGAGRLVHLAEDHRGLVDDARLLHLLVELRPLSGALAHAGKDREAAVLVGDVTDKLHDQDGLADASAAEEADLSAPGIRRRAGRQP